MEPLKDKSFTCPIGYDRNCMVVIEKVLTLDSVQTANYNLREDLRAMLFKIALDHGGEILHYNDKVDELYNKHFGDLENGKDIKYS